MLKQFILPVVFLMFCLHVHAQQEKKDQRKQQKWNSASEQKRIQASVRKNAERFLRESRINAVSIGVYKKGQTHIGHFGELDKGKGNPPSNETIYEIASVTKTFTGLLVAQAERDKKLNLQDDVRKYLKGDFPNLQYQGKPIRVKDLVTHSSGLPSELPESAERLMATPGSDVPEKLEKIFKNYDKSKFFADLRKVTLSSTPGKKFVYSSVGTELLAHILENVYAKTYAELLKKHVFQKANMNSTKLLLSPNEKRKLANGYGPKGKLAPHFVVSLWGASGGLKSTMPDMVNYMKLQFDKTNPVVVKSHTLITYEDGRNFREGYFWQMRNSKKEGKYLFCHGGSYGSQIYLFIFPKHQLGITVVTNVSAPDVSGKLIKPINGILEDLR